MANPITNNPLGRCLRERPSPAGDQTETDVPPPLASPRIVDEQGEHCCGISDIGKVRDGNEDMFLLAPEHGLLVVADGLGGHAAGEVASALIVRTVYQTVVARLIEQRLSSRDILGAAFSEADNAVAAYTVEHAECRGMGATLIVALILGNQAVIGHIGDARAYVSRCGVLRRLTNDHTAVGLLLHANLISEDEARGHPARNMVSQAVMGRRDLAPDYTEIDLQGADRLMLCSDGLWDEVPHGEIEKILADDVSASQMATSIVDRAIAAGGSDNITAVIYQHRIHVVSPTVEEELEPIVESPERL